MLTNRKRKGFTLAELLIVVAIIAVLTAIAVPLFVKGIDNAKKTTGEANVRAVRGAAVTLILTNQYDTNGNATNYWTDEYKEKDAEGNPTKYKWIVTAQVSKSGDISKINIYKPNETSIAASQTENYDKAVKDGYYKDGDVYKIYLVLTETDLSTGE